MAAVRIAATPRRYLNGWIGHAVWPCHTSLHFLCTYVELNALPRAGVGRVILGGTVPKDPRSSSRCSAQSNKSSDARSELLVLANDSSACVCRSHPTKEKASCRQLSTCFMLRTTQDACCTQTASVEEGRGRESVRVRENTLDVHGEGYNQFTIFCMHRWREREMTMMMG